MLKGSKMSEEARQKMRAVWAERKADPNYVPVRKGIKHTLETRAKMSKVTRERTPRGEQCHSYKDGKLAERRDQRFSMQYKRWRYDVYLRDKFTCQECGDSRGGNLVAHHVKPFADFPDLRFDVSNGRTVCETCHDKIHDKPNSTRKLRRARKAAKQ